jgi:hypothetical protein
MLKELLEKLKAANIDSTELQGFISKYQAMEQEVSQSDSKLSALTNELKNTKGKINSIYKRIGVDKDEDLDNKLKSLNNNNNNNNSKEIKNLENLIREKEKELQTQKASYESALFDKDLNLELYKRSAALNTINKEAHSIVIQKIKEGAVLENGQIVYKNEDGTFIRKNGLPLSIDDKITELKTGDMSFLFKNDSKNGSGVTSGDLSQKTTASTNTEGMSDFSKTFLDRAKKANINIDFDKN